jgi:hypothetical protein
MLFFSLMKYVSLGGFQGNSQLEDWGIGWSMIWKTILEKNVTKYEGDTQEGY